MNKKRTTMGLPQETVNYLKAWMMLVLTEMRFEE
jgi:hypothetical protein